jgi:uncharacterized protein
MRALFPILTLACATPAIADVPQAVNAHILPGYAAFADATSALSDMAMGTCDRVLIQPAWNAAYDAWLGIAHIRLGPVEEDGRALAISFWPDPKGLGAKQQTAMIAASDPMGLDPTAFAEASVAVRGLTALERLLYAEAPLTGNYPCTLLATTAADLAQTARDIEAGWQSDFAETLLTAGTTGNPRFLSELEARQALFTQLVTGIEFVKDARIARPLGTFDAPRPDRAEARASGRAVTNIVASLTALRAYALALDPAASRTSAAFDRAITAAKVIPDPTLASITGPQIWLKLDILRGEVQALQDTAISEIGASLGVGVGFNAADGD